MLTSPISNNPPSKIGTKNFKKQRNFDRIANHSTGKSRHGTRSHWLGRFLDLDKAHTTISGDGKPTVVAKPRYVNPSDLAGLQHRHSLWNFDRVPINKHLNCVIRIGEVDSGSPKRSSRREIWFCGSCGSFGAVAVGCGDDGAKDIGFRCESGRSEEGSRSELSQPHCYLLTEASGAAAAAFGNLRWR